MNFQSFELNKLFDSEYNISFEYDDNMDDTLNKVFFREQVNTAITSDQKKSFEDTTLVNSIESSISDKPKGKSKAKKKNNLKFFVCICGKIYKSKENQLLHYQNIHLNQKPYKCSFCNSSFSHRNGKTYHERKFHTFVMPYKCPYIEENCYCSYASKSALTFHVKSKHCKNFK